MYFLKKIHIASICLLGQFTEEELNVVVLTKMKSRKAGGLYKVPSEVWKTRKFDDLLFGFCNDVYKQNTTERWTKGCIFPFPKECDLRITKNYRAITLTFVAAKVYNVLLLNFLNLKLRRFLGEIRIGFGEINPQHHRFWQSMESLKKFVQKCIIQRFLQDIWFHTQRENEANTFCMWVSPKKLLLL